MKIITELQFEGLQTTLSNMHALLPNRKVADRFVNPNPMTFLCSVIIAGPDGGTIDKIHQKVILKISVNASLKNVRLNFGTKIVLAFYTHFTKFPPGWADWQKDCASPQFFSSMTNK